MFYEGILLICVFIRLIVFLNIKTNMNIQALILRQEKMY